MPNLQQAVVFATNIGRKPGGLIAGYTQDGNRFESVIMGSGDNYTVTIETAPETKWHCTCTDFHWTFHPFLDEQGAALFPFVVIDPPNGRGVPRAVAEYGMCKHLLAFTQRLTEDGFLKDT